MMQEMERIEDTAVSSPPQTKRRVQDSPFCLGSKKDYFLRFPNRYSEMIKLNR
jgi:hypothetical protein